MIESNEATSKPNQPDPLFDEIAEGVWRGVMIAGVLLLGWLLVELDYGPRLVTLRFFIAPMFVVSLLCFIAWQVAPTRPAWAAMLALISLAVVIVDDTLNTVLDTLHNAFHSDAKEDGPYVLLFFAVCVSTPLFLASEVLKAIRKRHPVVSIVEPEIFREPLEPEEPSPTQFETAAELLRAQARKHQGGPEAARYMRAAAEIETADTIARLQEILGEQFHDETIQQALRRAGIRVG